MILEWLRSHFQRQSIDKGNYDIVAVLSILHRQFHGNSKVGVEIGCCNELTIANDRARIGKYRDWLKTQPRPVVRSYEYWLSYYENGCNEAEKAIAGNAQQKFLDHWERAVANKLRAAEERAKVYPKPPHI